MNSGWATNIPKAKRREENADTVTESSLLQTDLHCSDCHSLVQQNIIKLKGQENLIDDVVLRKEHPGSKLPHPPPCVTPKDYLILAYPPLV